MKFVKVILLKATKRAYERESIIENIVVCNFFLLSDNENDPVKDHPFVNVGCTFPINEYF